MKYLIAIPCMDTVNTMFFMSMIDLKKIGECRVAVSRSSLVYDSRNKLAEMAINEGYDRILWLDSDMIFDPDTMEKLAADLDSGKEFVTGLCFSRKPPIRPCIYNELKVGGMDEEAVVYKDYPKDELFQVKAAGFACVMMEVKMLKRLWDKYGAPFTPLPQWGEDLSFCIRARDEQLWCDSRIKIGHLGQTIINEETYTGKTTII